MTHLLTLVLRACAQTHVEQLQWKMSSYDSVALRPYKCQQKSHSILAEPPFGLGSLTAVTGESRAVASVPLADLQHAENGTEAGGVVEGHADEEGEDGDAPKQVLAGQEDLGNEVC